MTETKCFRDSFRDQLHELSGHPNAYAVIFGFRYLSISVLLKNEEKHVDILERKIIRTERENGYFMY